MKLFKYLFPTLLLLTGLVAWWAYGCDEKYNIYNSLVFLFVGALATLLGYCLPFFFQYFSLRNKITSKNIAPWNKASLLVAIGAIIFSAFLYFLGYYAFYPILLFGYAALVRYLFWGKTRK